MLTRIVILSFLMASSAIAEDVNTLANILFGRLTGGHILPANSAERDQMKQFIQNHQYHHAARIATEHAEFCNSGIREAWRVKLAGGLAADPSAPMNDALALFMKIACVDKRPVKDAILVNASIAIDLSKITPDQAGRTPEFDYVNNQFGFLEREGIPITSTMLISPQNPNLPPSAAAGLLTLPGYGEKSLLMGTNRRAIEFPLLDFTGKQNLPDFFDTTRSDVYVTGDVARNPQALYRSECAGCHSHIDALRPAACKLDVNNQGKVTYATNGCVAKINNPASKIHPEIPNLTTSAWEVLPSSTYSQMGFRGNLSGNSYAEFAQLIANSKAFSIETIRHIYRNFCNAQDPTPEAEPIIEQIAADFEYNNYGLHYAYERVAHVFFEQCVGVPE